TPIQKQQLAKELVGSVMVELGYKALEVKIVANTKPTPTPTIMTIPTTTEQAIMAKTTTST
ncbi:hypothetical protein, partial [uncultured Gammaproteobacteria bacterium]